MATKYNPLIRRDRTPVIARPRSRANFYRKIAQGKLPAAIAIFCLAMPGVILAAGQAAASQNEYQSAARVAVAQAESATPLAGEAANPENPAEKSNQEVTPAKPDTELWRDRVLVLIKDIDLGKRSSKEADKLYEELSHELQLKRNSLREALRWASSPDDTLTEDDVEAEVQGGAAVTVEDVYLSMVSLYQSRLELMQWISPGLKSRITGVNEVGAEKLRNEMEYMLLYLRFHAMAIPQQGPRLLKSFIEVPLQVAWNLLTLILTIVLFRYWWQWAPQGLVDLRARIIQIRPRTKRSLRLARLVWYFQQVRHPLEWMLLLSIVFDVLATPALQVIENFVQIILSGLLLAWFAVRLINAIASRGVAGLSDDTADLRLRSLRLIAGWILFLSLGLQLTETYTGEGTTYARVWTLFQVLSIPVVILLLTWWRLEIRKELLDLPVLPGWVKKTTETRSGPKKYLNILLGGSYLVFIFLRQFAVRQLSKFKSGREFVVMLIGRELNREYDRKVESSEIGPISDELKNQLMTGDGIINEKIYGKELRRLCEIVEFGHGGLVAIVGERGLGKSQFLQRLAGNFKDQSIVIKCNMRGFEGVKQAYADHFQVPVEELDPDRFAELVRSHNVRFIAFDNLHYLIRPRMGGDTELNRLVEFSSVMRSKLQICLIFTMVKPAYMYLKSLRADNALQEDCIELPEWSQEQISEMIEARSRNAGIEPDFSGIEIPHQFDEIDYDSRTERARAGFYRILWGVSAGNPVVALRLWIHSLAMTADGRVIVQLLPQVFTGEQLENASLPVLLMLRVIVQSGKTTLEDIAESLRLAPVVIENGIRFALFRGWIEEIDGYYQITWQWFRTINRVLVRQNLLTR